jgi:hypothetical protein
MKVDYMTRDCDNEWRRARKYCHSLYRAFNRPRGVFGKTMDDCMLGQVSERCGGNPVSK